MRLWPLLLVLPRKGNNGIHAWTYSTRVSHTQPPPPKSPSAIHFTVPVDIDTIESSPSSSSFNGSSVSSSPPLSAWDILAGNMGHCLIASDLKRDSGFDGSSTGWTSWVDSKSAFQLQNCIDKLVFSDSNLDAKTDLDGPSTMVSTSQRDDTIRWLKWMKACPAPMIIGFDDELRSAVNATLTPNDYELVEQTQYEFLSRVACRVILVPSGGTLCDNLRTPPGAMVYGKLLYGGVTRYRILGNAGHGKPTRKVGERTVLAPPATTSSSSSSLNVVPTEAWLQYGGPERNYEAVDIGPCALMEITILPKGLTLPPFGGSLGRKDDETTLSGVSTTTITTSAVDTQEMIATRSTACNPRWLFYFPPVAAQSSNETSTVAQALSTNSGEFNNELGNQYSLNDVESSLSSVLGGLQSEIQSIIRRVLDGRVHPSTSCRREEQQALLELGLSPIRGVLLFGQPGCGKTALAREVSRLLTERPPKIVSAPELLDRWVGGSEKLVRQLFADAEAELNLCNGDVTKSGIHVVVIDEIDAVFRTRSSSSGGGEVARASAVNQILAKLDGVNPIGNVLVIGTTNRRDLLDEALLRPGRLEVQIEVPLPTKEGRREILNIYFAPMRRQGRLSQPLCSAIDGDSSGRTPTFERNRTVQGRSLKNLLSIVRRWTSSSLASWSARYSFSGSGRIHDLASDRWTGGYSGADLEGLVRCAASHALSRARQEGNGVEGLLVTVEDVLNALREVQE
jgi:vesicle-fusing ATPase